MTDPQVQKQESFIPSGTGKVFATRWSPLVKRDPSPIVLLHDSLGCVALWRDFPERLALTTGREVIAYDRMGFGRSSARKELPSIHFITEESETTLPSVLSFYEADEFHLFGHSVGGSMALTAASRLPGCRSVVTEAAQSFVEKRTYEGILKAKNDFANPDHFNRLTKYHDDKAAWVLQAWTEIWLSPEFANWSLNPILAQILCPILAIHGDQDEYGSNAFPERICNLSGGPSQMIILPKCGHVPHREQPEQTLERVHHFYFGGTQ